MFTSNARQSAARQAAEAARHAAADAFVALDETQQSVSMLVEAFAGLDAGAEGRRIRQELAPLTSASDAAHAAWIDTLDRHAHVLADDDADIRPLQAAEAAFVQVKATLAQAQSQLETFSRHHRDIENRVQAAWAEVSPKTAEAQQALVRARDAVTATTETGIYSPDLEGLLAHAERLSRPVQDGPHQHGVAATLRHCAEAVAASNAVVAAAERLRDLAPDTQRRISSTRTRLDGVTARLAQIEPTLSLLRRRYSMACSDDLDHVPTQAESALETARTLLGQAQGHGRAGHWDQAAAALGRCRDRVADAEADVNAVVQRLRDLDAVASDPAAEKERVWFVVRDAQRLVVSVADQVPSNEVTVLDGLVARLAKVDQKLEGNHPDYWSYLSELRTIGELAAAVVRRTRAAIAADR